jgi:hypothetical protein
MNKLVKFKVFMAMSMEMAVSGMLWLVGTGRYQGDHCFDDGGSKLL